MVKRVWAIVVSLTLILCFCGVIAANRSLSPEGERQRAFRAAERGDIEELGRLLDRGLSPNARVRSDNLWILRKLNHEDEFFRYGTPLIVGAAYGRHYETVRYLLDRGADVNNPGPAGETALLEAAGQDDAKMVRLLLSRGADPYMCWKDGSLPESHNPEVQRLLEHGMADWKRRGLPSVRHRREPSPGSY